MFQAASGGLTQVSFEFGKGHFDGIKVWTIGGQITHGGSLLADEFFDVLDFVSGKIVEDDHIAFAQLWTEDMLKVSGEDIGIDGPFDEEGSRQTFITQGGNKGGGVPGPCGTLLKQRSPSRARP